MDTENIIVKGEDITRIYTLGSKYDQNSVEIQDKNRNIFRIRVTDLLPILTKINFKGKKAKKYTYLEMEQNSKDEEDLEESVYRLIDELQNRLESLENVLPIDAKEICSYLDEVYQDIKSLSG